jgi:hypothetical protein
MFSFAARFMPTRWQSSDDPLDDPETEPDRTLGLTERLNLPEMKRQGAP